tara:strand:+ start:1547 stop:4711 length:3165 start_codon:yes stop_codon:yes gene_type:complete
MASAWTAWELHPAPKRVREVAHWQQGDGTNDVLVAAEGPEGKRSALKLAQSPRVQVVQVVRDATNAYTTLVDGGAAGSGGARTDAGAPLVVALVLEEGASRPLNVTVTVRRGEVDVASAVLPPTTMDGLSAACVACPAPHKVEVRRWRIERQKLSGSGNVEGAPDVTDLGFDLQAIRKLTQMAEALTKANSAQLFKEKSSLWTRPLQQIVGLLASQDEQTTQNKAWRVDENEKYELKFEEVQTIRYEVVVRADERAEPVWTAVSDGRRVSSDILAALKRFKAVEDAAIRILENANGVESTTSLHEALDAANPANESAENLAEVPPWVRVLPHALGLNAMRALRAEDEGGAQEFAEADRQLAKALAVSREEARSASAALPAQLRLVQSFNFGDGNRPPGAAWALRQEAQADAKIRLASARGRWTDNLALAGVLPEEVALSLFPFAPVGAGLDTSMLGRPKTELLQKLRLDARNEAMAAVHAFGDFVIHDALGKPPPNKDAGEVEQRVYLRERIIESAVRTAQDRAVAASKVIDEVLGKAGEAVTSGMPPLVGAHGGLDAAFALRRLSAWERLRRGQETTWSVPAASSARAFAKALRSLGLSGTSLPINPSRLPFVALQSIGYFPLTVDSIALRSGTLGVPLMEMQHNVVAARYEAEVATLPLALRPSGSVEFLEMCRRAAIESAERVQVLSAQLPRWNESAGRTREERTAVVTRLALMSRPSMLLSAELLPEKEADQVRGQQGVPRRPAQSWTPAVLQGSWGARCLDREFVAGPMSGSPMQQVCALLAKVNVNAGERRSFFAPFGSGLGSAAGTVANPAASEQRVWVEPAVEALDQLVRALETESGVRSETGRMGRVQTQKVGRGQDEEREAVHPYLVQLERKASRVVVTVARAEAAWEAKDLRSGLSGTIQAAANDLVAVARGEETLAKVQEELEAEVEATRSLMFSADRLYQGLQLVALQSDAVEEELGTLEVVLSPGSERKELAAWVGAFGMLPNVCTLSWTQVQVDAALSKERRGEEAEWLRGVALGLKTAQEKGVRAVPLCELSAVLGVR